MEPEVIYEEVKKPKERYESMNYDNEKELKKQIE